MQPKQRKINNKITKIKIKPINTIFGKGAKSTKAVEWGATVYHRQDLWNRYL